jgi:hypothetical protein
MVDRKVVPFDEFYYQLKLMYLFLLHVVCNLCFNLCLLARGVPVSTYDFGFMDNLITKFDRSL